MATDTVTQVTQDLEACNLTPVKPLSEFYDTPELKAMLEKCNKVMNSFKREQSSLVEHRVVLPMTVDEYQVAQLYSVAEASKNETGGGEGIEVLVNEPFVFDKNAPEAEQKRLRANDGSEMLKGQYTHKIYHLESRVPSFVRFLAPKGSLDIHEIAWNAYPFCRTMIMNPDYMKEGFIIVIETLHLNDNGTSENVHHLNKKDFGNCAKEIIDISAPLKNPKSDYKEEWDPAKKRSEKTGRGPLICDKEQGSTHSSWMKGSDTQPVMCCYKLVSCKFKWIGIGGKVQNYIQKAENRIFTNFHRQVFCWMDQWYGLKMDDIRQIEKQTKEELDAARLQGSIRGTTSDFEDDKKK